MFSGWFTILLKVFGARISRFDIYLSLWVCTIDVEFAKFFNLLCYSELSVYVKIIVFSAEMFFYRVI